MSGIRALHLRGALGAVRTEQWDGREHLVVPCVALQEAAIHAINAKTREFVPASTLTNSVGRWNGHPLVVGHPVRDGRQISAHDADVMSRHSFGFIRGAHMKGTRLGMEAMVDPARLEALGQQQLLADLRAGKAIEVSVGAFVTTNDKKGSHNGREWDGEWADITPDHLAFLPGGVGACSLEMGCGAHRAAQTYLVTAEEFQPVKGSSMNLNDLKAKMLALFDTPEEEGGEDELVVDTEELKALYGKTISAATMKTVQSAHDASHDMHSHCVALGAECSGMKVLEGQKVVVEFDGKKIAEGVLAGLAAKDCPTCEGTGQITKNEHQSDCPACSGSGVFTAAENGGNPAAESEDHMKKTDAIKALTACPCSGFTTADVPFLETLSEARLDEHVATGVARKKVEDDLKAATDKIAATDVALKAAEAKQTEVDAKLAAVQPIVAEYEARVAAEKTSLIKTLEASKVLTAAELETKTLGELQTLAKFAKVESPVDYSGRGVAVPRAAQSGEDFTPPNPYEAPLKALSAKVN